MPTFPLFLSVVLVVRDEATVLEPLLRDAERAIADVVSDYELIVVDNASTDGSLDVLQRLTGDDGLANLQVYALTKEVDRDTAAWVGLENALGDFVAVIDPQVDDIGFLPSMLDRAVAGSDVVFASNDTRASQDVAYAGAFKLFNSVYRWFSGIDLANEAPQFRLLSKRVVGFMLQHSQPAVTYRHLPATAGFVRSYLHYDAPPRRGAPKKNLGESVDRGMRLLVSTTRAPMRLVTALSLFGAVANVVYSIYVVVVALVKTDVAPGWVSLSMQQSGMFFLISLVLLVLGEYILHMSSLSNEGPLYHVAREMTSVRMTRREKLNVETVEPTSDLGAPPVRVGHALR